MRKIKISESDLINVIRRIVEDSNDDSEDTNTNLLMALRAFAKGKISSDDLYEVDDSIHYIDKKTPLGQTILTIEFEDEDELLSLIDLDENDRWFMRALNSYDGYEFLDSYQISQDFQEGYIVYYDLNEENTEKLKEISAVILSGTNFDLNNEEFRSSLSEVLLDMFPREVDDILSDYHMEKEHEMNIVAKRAVKTEFDDVLENIGVSINYNFDKIDVKLADLYMSALQSNLYNDNAKEMVTNIIKKSAGGHSFGGWAENSYEFQDQNEFDSESFNNYVGKRFDDILETLESNSDEINGGITEYLEFRNRIISKFKLNGWYDLPKDKKYRFKIKEFDRNDMKIIVELQTPLGFKQVKLSEENFNYLLYQPSLFNLEEI